VSGVGSDGAAGLQRLLLLLRGKEKTHAQTTRPEHESRFSRRTGRKRGVMTASPPHPGNYSLKSSINL